MKKHFFPLVLCTILSFFSFIGNANAKNKVPVYDSTACCKPDSVTIDSIHYPVFCMTWRIPVDSIDSPICKAPYGFQIQWRAIFNTTWHERIVLYTSGTIFHFCDSLDTCGRFFFRVRSICVSNGDTTYSDWLSTPKTLVPCGGNFGQRSSNIKISPDHEIKTVSTESKVRKLRKVKPSVVNMTGRNGIDEIINVQNSELRKRLKICTLQKKGYLARVCSQHIRERNSQRELLFLRIQ